MICPNDCTQFHLRRFVIWWELQNIIQTVFVVLITLLVKPTINTTNFLSAVIVVFVIDHSPCFNTDCMRCWVWVAKCFIGLLNGTALNVWTQLCYTHDNITFFEHCYHVIYYERTKQEICMPFWMLYWLQLHLLSRSIAYITKFQ